MQTRRRAGLRSFPGLASCRISLSSVRSAIALRSRVFSVSRSFSRLTWSLLSPPNSWRQREYVTSVTPIERTASATLCPCDTSTSTWRSFATISSGLCLFLAIVVLLGSKAIPQGGPLQRRRISRDHHRIAEAFLRLLHGGSIRFAALLVPHQFDAAGQRGHLFQDPLCALRTVMPWRPEWIEGTKGGGTISSTWWVWTAESRPSASPGTVWVKRRPCASTRTGQATTERA